MQDLLRSTLSQFMAKIRSLSLEVHLTLSKPTRTHHQQELMAPPEHQDQDTLFTEAVEEAKVVLLKSKKKKMRGKDSPLLPPSNKA